MRRSLVSGALVPALLLAAPALAAAPGPDALATPPAATASASSKHEYGGPLIAGVCLLSREQVFAQSKVGQAAAARLRQLSQRAQAGFEADRRKIEAEAKALRAQQMTLQPAQIQHRQQQLEARAQALQTGAAQVGRELEATRTKVTGQIEEAIQPIVQAAYQSKACGLLLSREAVVGGNLGNDLTDTVLQGLDAKMTTITFEREHLPPTAP
jgi:Skp family chaperone for outer membrane proteins